MPTETHGKDYSSQLLRMPWVCIALKHIAVVPLPHAKFYSIHNELKSIVACYRDNFSGPLSMSCSTDVQSRQLNFNVSPTLACLNFQSLRLRKSRYLLVEGGYMQHWKMSMHTKQILIPNKARHNEVVPIICSSQRY